MISFLFFDFFSDLGFGSVHLKAETFSFPHFFNPVRVRVLTPLSVRGLGFGLKCRDPYLFSDLNTDVLLLFSCRAPVRTAVRHLSPLGGGGDRGSSDVRHPGLFSICFYPIRVRVTH